MGKERPYEDFQTPTDNAVIL